MVLHTKLTGLLCLLDRFITFKTLCSAQAVGEISEKFKEDVFKFVIQYIFKKDLSALGITVIGEINDFCQTIDEVFSRPSSMEELNGLVFHYFYSHFKNIKNKLIIDCYDDFDNNMKGIFSDYVESIYSPLRDKLYSEIRSGTNIAKSTEISFKLSKSQSKFNTFMRIDILGRMQDNFLRLKMGELINGMGYNYNRYCITDNLKIEKEIRPYKSDFLKLKTSLKKQKKRFSNNQLIQEFFNSCSDGGITQYFPIFRQFMVTWIFEEAMEKFSLLENYRDVYTRMVKLYEEVLEFAKSNGINEDSTLKEIRSRFSEEYTNLKSEVVDRGGVSVQVFETIFEVTFLDNETGLFFDKLMTGTMAIGM